MQLTGSIGAVWPSKYVTDAFMVTIDILKAKFIAIPNPSKWATSEGKRPPSHILFIYKTHTGASAINHESPNPSLAENPQVALYQGTIGGSQGAGSSFLEAQRAFPSGIHNEPPLPHLGVRGEHLGLQGKIHSLEASGEAKTRR